MVHLEICHCPVGIRVLQCMLLKVCLLLGIKVFDGVEFCQLLEPSGDKGWTIRTSPSCDASQRQYDIMVGADGKKYCLPGFKAKEFRAKLAIAITVNFVNNNTTAEASVEEISGVSYIYNQDFFNNLRKKHGIDLENIVYYKDETHYFVMTAKKQSLLKKGVLKQVRKCLCICTYVCIYEYFMYYRTRPIRLIYFHHPTLIERH